jgi:1,4-alpha-glucan branching enzyme
MLKRSRGTRGRTKVTFVLPDAGVPVSVVGDFNGWNPDEHPLRKRSNGTRSVAVELDGGRVHPFRYYDELGSWFDDPEADAFEPNGFGGTHSLVKL